MRFLLDRGADIDLVEKMNGGTPIGWAHIFGNAEVAKLLLERGAEASIAILCAYAPIGRIKGALEGGAGEVDLERADFHGHTALMNALLADREDVAVLLLDQGADSEHSNGEG